MADGRAARSTIDGNRLTLIPDGPERLEALLGLIDGAKTIAAPALLHLSAPTQSATGCATRCSRAIDRGVEVALLIDGFGSSDTRDDYFTRLSDARRPLLPLQPALWPALSAAQSPEARAGRR